MDSDFKKALENLVYQLESKIYKVSRVQKELLDLIEAASANGRKYKTLVNRLKNYQIINLPNEMPKKPLYAPKALRIENIKLLQRLAQEYNKER